MVDRSDQAKPAPCIMVLGTTSDAGKSWMVTALCRYYSNLGLQVAPFKAQNMSNNARVVARAGGGFGEIGSAQYFQALAARCTPSLDMNPVLLKPESDRSSQVVLMGRVDTELSATPWRERSAHLWPHIQAALDRMRAEFDLVIIEGAGSPAEINLRDRDIVNMEVAHYAQAECLLVCDIDRGGAFAHLYGTWALLDARDQGRIKAFVLNKFRGDPKLLEPGPAMLFERTQVPIAGVIPMLREHRLPEEDGQSVSTSNHRADPRPRIVVISYPRISNLDEFTPLSQLEGRTFTWTQNPKCVLEADLLILPGSKNSKDDLAWLRQHGLDRAIVQFAESGKPVLGICGGLQMLGQRICGEELSKAPGQEHNAHQNEIEGLGLLGIESHFCEEKTLGPAKAKLPTIEKGPWSALSGLELKGYEIHVGQTNVSNHHPAIALVPRTVWKNPGGNVLGIYLHGVFEDPALLRALFNEETNSLDPSFDALAQTIAETRIPELFKPHRRRRDS